LCNYTIYQNFNLSCTFLYRLFRKIVSLQINLKKQMNMKTMCALGAIGVLGIAINISAIESVNAASRTFNDFEAVPPIHTMAGSGVTSLPKGLTPAQIKTAYLLPASGGSGTIAIISAFEHPAIENDLAAFDKQFKITGCTIANKCLTVHDMKTAMTSTKIGSKNAGWDLESALDTEWAHAIAPKAQILFIEASSTKGKDLLSAVDYARTQPGVVSVSMSWGGSEFAGETALDDHFLTATSTKSIGTKFDIAFFASSGDDGTGASWPAVSPNVIAVGGTSLVMTNTGTTAKFSSEKAWSGSGGGISEYETEPTYQKTYSIPRANGKRAIPDVSFAADPAHGFSVYHNGWYVIGGTSAGAPQWAAIAALGVGGRKKYPISVSELYKDKAYSLNALFFRDIISGSNGTCGYYCSARARYDYVTGLGSPITDQF
jgi:subtilase family serine protease